MMRNNLLNRKEGLHGIYEDEDSPKGVADRCLFERLWADAIRPASSHESAFDSLRAAALVLLSRHETDLSDEMDFLSEVAARVVGENEKEMLSMFGIDFALEAE